ncbi:FG-nucleoporin nsp1 [Exophiala xenobiotica]|nr:FG-nucleoporin nsp1 [Exophiala xenobiotica]KAK5392617.1 FG-nucleoporin nsp1 [Exophiala xenobiotica]KAK5424236.1 FG-nucleoporin nsp1 [Exophiala xenobiotica]KAK5457518.1 FG-nucleoporin nsp1 [Exophiala xenobiotica]KAK5474516.1 FG-nucleoporin nsp1 [Exophiala xenobiotica]
MSFSFNPPSSSGGASGQSLFGTTNKPATGDGLFGNTGTSGASTTGFGFGGQPASAGTSSQGLFGAASTTENKPNLPSLFGNGAGSSGGLFGGQNPQDGQGGDGSKPTFSFGTPDKSSTPSSSAPSIFGSTTPAPSGTSNTFSFGNASTTPAGPPPSGTTFSASTGGAGLFGAKPADSQSKPTFGFPKPEAPATGSSAPSGGLFGSKPATGGFGFGAPKPAESTSASTPAAPVATEAPKSAFSFGPPTTTTAAPTTSTSATSQQTSSGAMPSLFGAAPPQENTGSNLFSKPAASETAAAPKPTFSFGPPSTQTSAPLTQAQTSSAPASKPLFGGFNQSAATTAPAATTSATTTTAPATSAPATKPFSFGPSTTTATSQPATTSAPAASSFSFGPATTSSGAQPTTTPSAAARTPSAPAAGQSTVGAQTSTTGPLPPAQSRLRNKTMDEVLTHWATDMSRYSKEFKEQAETIARWDQIIVDNSSKIDKLYVRTRTCERQTMSVDMQLAAVENQQTELESWLTKYENDVDEMLAKDNANPSELGGPDQERERTYKLAEKLGERLDEMERDLGSMVEEVTAANASLSKNGKADEPITQIVKILNSHLTQLQAIDQGTVALQDKVAAAQKAASNMGYLNGSMSQGSGAAAVQDFYRSYMGRR